MSVPLVTLHGFLGDPSDWDALLETLDAPRAVVPIALPGHGPGASTEMPETFDGAVKHIEARIESSCDTSKGIDLLAYSMGGRIALAIVAGMRLTVRRAVVVGASAGLVSADLRTERLMQDVERAHSLIKQGLPRFLSTWYEMPLFQPFRASRAFAETVTRREQGDAKALATALLAMSVAQQNDLRPRLAKSKSSMLLVAGALDEKYMDENASLVAKNERFESKAIYETGHCPHLEAPERTARVVGPFLAG